MEHYAELNLELLDEVVLSSRSVTVGEHQSLDYIPGSVLLGWAASQLYSKLTADQAFMVFHSGQVRFGNGLPLLDGNGKTHPMPLCWHEDKGGESAIRDGRLDAEKLFNMAHGKPVDLKQPRQLRKGYVAENGTVMQPLKSYRMKTAIDADKGTAKESQLFGFESLQRGQCFAANIAADKSVPADLFNVVVNVFDQTLRIGRSRSAQYGRVKSKVVGHNPVSQPDIVGQKSLSLWLQSDLAVRDKNGMPTLLPESPTVLGLPVGRLKLEKSFVRFRSYAPYNAHHRCYESDRQVIVAGSVLHYEFDEPLTSSDAELLADGLGVYREAGLGAVCANHSWLQSKIPQFKSDSPQPPDQFAPAITHPLIQFLQRKAGESGAEQLAKEWAEKKVLELGGLYQSARHYNGVSQEEAIGPGRSQWRRVQEAVIHGDSAIALFDEISGVCKSKDEEWKREYAAGQTFRSWLQEIVKQLENQPHFALYMQWLARKAEALRDAGLKETQQ